MTIRRPEQSLQRAIIRWWRLAHRSLGVADERLLMHIPNGGRRSKVEAAIFQSLGVRAGVPDLLLAYPANGYGALWIEVKAGKGGRLSGAQHQMAELLQRAGHAHCVARNIDEAIAGICRYLRASGGSPAPLGAQE